MGFEVVNLDKVFLKHNFGESLKNFGVEKASQMIPPGLFSQLAIQYAHISLVGWVSK